MDWSLALHFLLLHFLLGFAAALLVCWLILIIFRWCGVTKDRERSMRLWLLGLALSLAIVSHVLEDYWLKLFH